MANLKEDMYNYYVPVTETKREHRLSLSFCYNYLLYHQEVPVENISLRSSWVVVAHTFNHSTWEAEADGSLSLRPAWSTERVPGLSEIHKETVSQKKPKQTNKQQNKIKPSPIHSLIFLYFFILCCFSIFTHSSCMDAPIHIPTYLPLTCSCIPQSYYFFFLRQGLRWLRMACS